MESTVLTGSQVMTKNNTFPLNHSLACASYASHLAIHTCNGGFKVGGARGKTKKGGPSDYVIILSQPR